MKHRQKGSKLRYLKGVWPAGRSRAAFSAALLALALLAGTSACGLKAGTQTYNDPAPNDLVVGQGSFNGQNGQTVSGTALVYDAGGGSYIIRLSGFAAPSFNDLQLRVDVNGTSEVLVAPLRGLSGNQNYYATFPSNSAFTAVEIFSPSAPSGGEDYGRASLTAPPT